jgi:coproporphyrinogen III oxidase-like Fe-S oxidoreductase
MLPRHLRQGLLEECDDHVRLTREGRFLADTVFAEYV